MIESLLTSSETLTTFDVEKPVIGAGESTRKICSKMKVNRCYIKTT